MNILTLYRQKNGLSQRQLAERLGITQGAIADIERGRRRVGWALAAEIERLTGGEISKTVLRPDIYAAPRAA